MQCNIDKRGRAARLIWGIMLCIAGVVLLGLALAEVLSGWWVWLLVVVCLTGGPFAIFEARKGWCAVRAMGVRTPM